MVQLLFIQLHSFSEDQYTVDDTASIIDQVLYILYDNINLYTEYQLTQYSEDDGFLTCAHHSCTQKNATLLGEI